MLLEKFQQHIKNHFGLQPGQVKFLLAVSGGIDSCVLTDLMYKSGFDFIIAHCNFQLREAASDSDEAFVRSLEQQYNKPVFVKTFDAINYAHENKLSVQETARVLRYNWFNELANEQLFATNYKIVTAHNANDNIETLMMHFFRGTGLHGLTGIPENDIARKIIRPLLFAKREAIAGYAKDNGIQWVEDASNKTDKYTRNFFRLQLIPAIKEVFENTEDNLLHNIERLKEAEQLYNESVALYKRKLLFQKENEWHIPVLKLQKSGTVNTIIWEIIKGFNFSMAQITEVKKLFTAENGSYTRSATHRIIRNRAWLIIAPLQTTTAQHILIDAGDKKTTFENGVIKIELLSSKNHQLQTINNVAAINSAQITYPLLLRKWKRGDYFYPLGMQKKKKLSKFLIDQKLSKTDKEKVWVIESNKKIVWIVGYRIDYRFKITDKCKAILRMEFLLDTRP